MLAKFAVIAASALIATSALADNKGHVVETHMLKDGSTLSVYEDGKTAVSDKFGNPVIKEDGSVLETVRGEKVMVKGNEIWRLHTRPTP